MKKESSFIISLLLSLSLFTTASADILTVSKTTDDGSANTLRWALEWASHNFLDTVVFDLPSSVNYINLTSPINISTPQGLIIEGPGANNVIIRDGTGYIQGSTYSGMLNITGGAVTIKDVTIQYASTGYRSIVSSKPLTLQGCIVDRGGGIHATADITVKDSNISGNIFNDNGGGISIENGFLDINNSIIVDNLVADDAILLKGGGIYVEHNATVSITNSVITENRAGGSNDDGSGGGIYIASDSDITISDTNITSNRALRGAGGGIYRTSSSVYNKLTLINCTVDNNSNSNSISGGGGIYCDTELKLVDTNITNNNLAPVDFINYEYAAGGGIYTAQSDGMVQMLRCIVSNNYADTEGGGMAGVKKAFIEESEFSNNASGTDGGGIYFQNSDDATVINSTFSANRAVGNGGGVAFGTGSPDRWVLFNFSTFTANVCDDNNDSNGTGGGIWSGGTQSNTVYLKGTLIAGNHTGLKADDDVDASFYSFGYNLISLGGGTGITDGVNNDQVGYSGGVIDAKLGPLANNGGPTKTHALLKGSPAIDAAAEGALGNTTTNLLHNDQRNFPRPQGSAADIGAFESDILFNLVPIYYLLNN